MKIPLFRSFLVSLYLIGITAAAVATWYGWDYYQLPMIDRPHNGLHSALKPGGMIGHGFGIVGSSMVLLLFLYSLRKRNICGLRFGSMKRWLDIHIWLGIIGPLFITVHTAGKFNGIVSISYFSMMVVVMSGFLGRYIYMQIPRDDNGMELSLDDIDTKIFALGTLLHDDYHVPEKVNKLIDSFSGRIEGARLSNWQALCSLFVFDLLKPIRTFRLGRHIRSEFPDFPKYALKEIVSLARKKATFVRRRALLGTLNSVFHYWHVFHKPFAVIMIVIMMLHIVIVVLMGSRWIF